METMPIEPAELLKEESYYVTGGYKMVDRWFRVPVDYSRYNSFLTIFAQTAVPNDKNDDGEYGSTLPYFVYLEGGPGFECGSPKSHPLTSFLFKKGYQVLYLDQRGTGLSSPVHPDLLAQQGDTLAQAQFIMNFRADNIVRDCEAIRKTLLGDKEKIQKWSIIGQSFGGFCATTYLSLHPEGLKEVFTSGGMPPLVKNPDEVYPRLYEKVKSRNIVYYKKYPQDVANVRKILDHLTWAKVLLPNGGSLTPRRFLDLGIAFGGHGGIDTVHSIVRRASNDLDIYQELSYKTKQLIEQSQTLDGNVLYALCHEIIYCQGRAPNWSAERHKKDIQFSWEAMKKLPGKTAVFFTGEMIYPWMFDDYSELRKLKTIANILAKHSDWPLLYDEQQLAKNKVPVYAATYIEDMYVDFNFARETVKKINGAKEFVTNTLYHNALRSRTEWVMGELWRLKVGEED